MLLRVKSLTENKWTNSTGERCEQWTWQIAFPNGTFKRYTTGKNGKGIYEFYTDKVIAEEKDFSLFGYSKSSVYVKIRRYFNYGGYINEQGN